MDSFYRLIEWIRELRPGSKLLLLLLPIMVSDIVLIAINITIYSYPNTTQFPILNDYKTALTFDGKSSFHDGNLEFLVDNNEKGSPKTLNVYGLDTQDTIDRSSSYLVDDTHKINTYTKLTITPSNKIVADAKLYDITLPILQQPGSYEGWIFVKGKDNVPIPITVATEPKVIAALLWVIIGIFTSIIFWEIIKYVSQIKNAQSNTNKQIQTERSEVTQRIAQNTKTAEQTVRNVAQNVIVNNLQEQKRKEIKQHIDLETKKQLESHLNTKLTSKAFVKVSIIDLGTIGFGIAVGFLALLSQGYVTAIRVIGPIEVIALVGLGLGIGSLREFLNKDLQQ